MGFTWFDHIFIILIGIVIPTLSIMSGKLSLENTPDLPPKKHLFYSNGLMLIIGALLVLSSWNIGEKSWGVLGFSWPVIDQKVIWLICSMILLYVLDLIYSFFTSDLLNKKLDSLSHVIPLNWQEYKHYIFLQFSENVSTNNFFFK